MAEQELFERPIQTLPAGSVWMGRFTLVQAAQRGDFGEEVYKSHGTWLLDTQGGNFRQWRAAYKGKRAREQHI